MSHNAKADFVLLFHADGHVELLDRRQQTVWSSDSDDDFIDEFGQEMFNDDEHSENILEYLDEAGMLDLDEDEIDIVENDLEDEAATDDEVDDILDADYTDTTSRVTPIKRNARNRRGSKQ